MKLLVSNKSIPLNQKNTRKVRKPKSPKGRIETEHWVDFKDGEKPYRFESPPQVMIALVGVHKPESFELQVGRRETSGFSVKVSRPDNLPSTPTMYISYFAVGT